MTPKGEGAGPADGAEADHVGSMLGFLAAPAGTGGGPALVSSPFMAGCPAPIAGGLGVFGTGPAIGPVLGIGIAPAGLGAAGAAAAPAPGSLGILGMPPIAGAP